MPDSQHVFLPLLFLYLCFRLSSYPCCLFCSCCRSWQFKLFLFKLFLCSIIFLYTAFCCSFKIVALAISIIFQHLCIFLLQCMFWRRKKLLLNGQYAFPLFLFLYLCLGLSSYPLFYYCCRSGQFKLFLFKLFLCSTIFFILFLCSFKIVALAVSIIFQHLCIFLL